MALPPTSAALSLKKPRPCNIPGKAGGFTVLAPQRGQTYKKPITRPPPSATLSPGERVDRATRSHQRARAG